MLQELQTIEKLNEIFIPRLKCTKMQVANDAPRAIDLEKKN